MSEMRELKMPEYQYKNLKEWIENEDYCYLCNNHPSSGHSDDCPFYEVDIVQETEIAIDNDILDFDDE